MYREIKGNGKQKKSNFKQIKYDEDIDDDKKIGIIPSNLSNDPPKKKKKKKIIRKIKKKKEVEEMEGGEKGDFTNLQSKMPPEEVKIPDNFDDDEATSEIVTKKRKKKIIRKKKKKKNRNGETENSTVNGEGIDETKTNTIQDKNGKKSGKNSDDKSNKSDSQDSNNTEYIEFDESENKYIMPSQLELFEYNKDYWKMLFYSNTFTNALFVTSYLCPRHIRASMCFTNLVLIWFLVAVFYNNTKDPLVVPNFDRKARSLAINEMWIALVAPLISMMVSYIFWGVFKVPDKRFHQPDSFENVKSGKLVKELIKEMYLRFFMAYFIMMAIFGAVMWYIIQFTAKFGWKVSWTWWYSGTFAFLFNYWLYDPIITWFHYVMYGCSRNMWRKVMAFRSIKIACQEVLDSYHIPNQPIEPHLKEMVQEEIKKIREGMKNYKENENNMPEDRKFINICFILITYLEEIPMSEIDSIRDIDTTNNLARNGHS